MEAVRNEVAVLSQCVKSQHETLAYLKGAYRPVQTGTLFNSHAASSDDCSSLSDNTGYIPSLMVFPPVSNSTVNTFANVVSSGHTANNQNEILTTQHSVNGIGKSQCNRVLSSIKVLI